MRPVVVYGGRFQPFHPGHYSVYKYLVEKFDKNNVWILSSNRVSENSPFSFEERKSIATAMFDIDPDKFILEKIPYSPVEFLEFFDQNKIILFIAVSKKDAKRFKNNKYYKFLSDSPYDLKPASKQGYVVITPVFEQGINASKIRNYFKMVNDKVLKRKFFVEIYKKFDEKIFNLFNNRLR